MQSIYFTPEHAAFRASVRQFIEAEVAPHASEWEEARRIPRSVFARMGDLGFLGITFPESLGGADADIFYAIAFLEELARSRMGGFCAAVAVQEFIATGAILRHGTEAQKQQFLVPSIAGRKVGAIAISEPDTGSDVAAIRTSAVREGADFLISGAKTWITNGVEGDFFVLACKTSAEGSSGISLLAFDADRPGIRRSKLRKLGWHSSDTAELAFENVRVPASSLVGEEGMGFYYIMETFALERLATAAISVGACVVGLEETLAYMESRQAFGRPLSRFQALRHRLADLFAELEAVRQLVYHAAWLFQTGASAVTEAAMAKLLATELNKKVADECLQFHGGFGYVEEYPIERFFRDARASTIVAGTSEIMREIVAKSRIDGVTFGPVAARDGEGREPKRPGEPEPQTPSVRDRPPEPVSEAVAKSTVSPDAVTALFHGLPGRLRADKAEGWNATFHFRLRESARPDWTVVVNGSVCEVHEGIHGVPNCTVQSTEKVFLELEAGERNPETAFLMGKIKVSNVPEMLRFIRAFRRPAR